MATAQAEPINLLSASIADLQSALSSGKLTSVSLCALYLHRIATYDSRPSTPPSSPNSTPTPALNAIPILNPTLFAEATASDAYRASGKPPRPLEGIPFTVKDSYHVTGHPVACGSPAFVNLHSKSDAFVVEKLRAAGAVIIGRTNMPPMAAGGMQRGVYGRAESPYNAEYLAAAFASGSSNGSAVATTAGLGGAFGLGSETVSSGRSPASNGGVVAYTPSRGLVSVRGVWPLYGTCDVLVPHAKTVEDLLRVIDVIAVEDPEGTVDGKGEFWRAQKWVSIPEVKNLRPMEGYLGLRDTQALKGKRIGVPKMYIGGKDAAPHARPVVTRQSVVDLWNEARKYLESLGAEVVEIDFPLVTNYENHGSETTLNVPGLPPNWDRMERSTIIAYSWDDYLRANGDAKIPDGPSVDGMKMFPRNMEDVQWRYCEQRNLVDYTTLFSAVANRHKSIFDIPGMEQALRALESTRKRDLEDQMSAQGLDLIVFPATGDVGKANADTEDESARHAWMNGVRYSNGNRAIRHLGVPTVTVPMGVMADTKMPVGLTFAGKAYDDNLLLKTAWAYEQASKKRVEPFLTPTLPSDVLDTQKGGYEKVDVSVSGERLDDNQYQQQQKKQARIKLTGQVQVLQGSKIESLEVYVDGKKIEVDLNEKGQWHTEAEAVIPEVAPHVKTDATILRDQVLVVAVARSSGGGIGGAFICL